MNEPTSKTLKFNIKCDYRVVILALIAAIIVMLLIWKPWSAASTSDRTVEVTGQSTISAKPDEFTFYPTYEFKNANQKAALEQMVVKSEELVAGLKKVGVAEKDIKVNSDSWSYPTSKLDGNEANTYTLRLTITTNSSELTQKVQDYLVSTTPSGIISPQSTFSEAKRKEIESQGRDEASKDARKKADQSAKNLGFKVASVKTVNDGAGFGTPYSMNERMVALDSASGTSLAVQPGENELSYSVTVTYYIK